MRSGSKLSASERSLLFEKGADGFDLSVLAFVGFATFSVMSAGGLCSVFCGAHDDSVLPVVYKILSCKLCLEIGEHIAAARRSCR